MPTLNAVLRRALLWPAFSLACLCMLSCEESITASPAAGCDDVRADVKYLDTTAMMFTATQPLTDLEGTVRTFFWDYEVDNLCVAAPEANNRAKFDVLVTATAPASLTMLGRVYHAAGFQPYSGAIVPKTVSAGVEYKGTVGNIGLVQGSFDGIRSNIISELVVSFTTTGSFDSDLALARSFLQNITMEVDYQYVKP